MHLFKGERDTFENFEWNFRDIGIQRFLNFGDTCSKCYMILGILFNIISGIRDTRDPLPRPQKYKGATLRLKILMFFRRSVATPRFFRRSFVVAKCRLGEMSYRRNVYSAKYV